MIITSQPVCIAEGQNLNAGLDLAPGHYARIEIKDNGIGMDKETCGRIFEPFFSTKFIGRGLGMAAAYGIVRNHDGWIEVTSQPGEGTCVAIYLPCLEST